VASPDELNYEQMKGACCATHNSRMYRIKAVQNATMKAGAKLGMQLSDPGISNVGGAQLVPPYVKTYWLFGINILMLMFSVIGMFFLSKRDPNIEQASPLVVISIFGEVLLSIDGALMVVEFLSLFREGSYYPDIALTVFKTDVKVCCGILGQVLGTLPVFIAFSGGASNAKSVFFLKVFCLLGMQFGSMRIFEEYQKRFSVVPSNVEKLMSLFQQFWIILIAIVGFSAGFTALHFHGHQNHWLDAIYWCLTTVTTTGYGDITPQGTPDTILSIVVIIVGPIVFASVIAYIVTFIQGSVHFCCW
jgi:general stress protein CsbA